MRQRIRFGTDGLRGPAGRWPIDYEMSERIGRAAALLAQSRGGRRVLIGRDTRPTGGILEDGVVAGVVGENARAVVAGVVPTSAVSIGVAAGLADVGVQITASHNPEADNGFKIVGAGGHKLDDDAVAQVEDWLLDDLSEKTATGRIEDARAAVIAAWETAAARLVPTGALRGRAIAVDLANGGSTACGAWLERVAGVAWTMIGADAAGRVNEGVGSEHPGALIAEVRDGGCDAGIAVDGDGDRCVLIDETGARVNGDALAWLLATRMGVSGLAVTVMSNGALEAHLPGVAVHRTPVGDRHLRVAMDAHGLPLGCEESGHVLFADLAGGDGLITGLRALALLRPGEPLSQAVAGFVPLPRVLTKVQVAKRVPLDQVPAIAAAAPAARARLGPGGRVFVRYSGTEPVLRILVEGDEAAAREVASAIAAAAREVLG